MPKILVADDNTNIQKMVVLAFQERAIDVISVGNGEAAVRRIPDLKPDLILADVFMPVRNGYEVCEFVKKNDQFSHIPVILMVGAFDPLDEKEARRVGADGVLKKPFVPPDPLIAMVTSALERNPKFMAELAKAKEIVAVLPPSPEVELPLKIEPKPLPEFPEPSPEEAALAYGFGSGQRDLDGESDKNVSKEPRTPVLEADEESEESDEPHASGDWRRAAMDFEIPEEAAKGPAHSVDMDPDSEMFPSEGDVAPKDVHTPKPAEKEDPAVLDDWALEPTTPESVTASFAEAVVPAFESAPPANAEALEVPEAPPALPPTEEEGIATEPEASDSWLAALPLVEESSQEEIPEAVEYDTPGFDPEFIVPPADEMPTLKDPQLVEPPPVEVTPEPLLEEEVEAPPEYQVRAQEIPPLYSFLPEVSEHSHNEQPAEQEVSVQAEAEISPATWHGESSERIPTAPPTDPEVFSDIPFLTPPSASDSGAEEADTVDPETVDALVRKLLEKIGPQLQEVLSQGVLKPLVEDLVQKGLAKKEK
ncbi:MAG: response regulator [Candidatus Acidiferrales bacterium]